MAVPAPTPVEVVSTWLYRIRIARGISQEALALRAGIAVPTYGRLERAGLSRGANGVMLDTFLRLIAVLEPDDGELAALLNSLRNIL
jgi:transcriptional regulator with XRE-family HTH domain